MKALLALLVALAGCSVPAGPPAPSGQIDGAVLDEMMQPIGGASVELLELGLVDVTSDLGGFTFRGVPVGSYTLRTIPDGTEGIIDSVDVRKDAVTRIILQPHHTEEPAPDIQRFHRSMTFSSPHPGQTHQFPGIPLAGVPDDVDVNARWSGTLDPPQVEVAMWDSAGEFLSRSKGFGTVHFRVDLSRMANGTAALVPIVEFVDQSAGAGIPQVEVTVELQVDVYYGTTYSRLMGLSE